MKKFSFLILSLIFSTSLLAQNYKVEGYYNGINLFVLNPISNPDSGGFCIDKVLVNGNEIPDIINSSAFKISFNKMDLSMGDKLEIEFSHAKGCEPEIINYEAIKPLSTFELKDYNIIDSHLEVMTTNEASSIDFMVEEYRWGDWVLLEKIKGKGGPSDNKYKIKIYPHSGSNMYRLKQVDYYNRENISDTLRYQPEMKKVKMESRKKVKDEIVFSGETLYQLINQFGEIVEFGGGKQIDVSELPKGEYFLNYGKNKTEEIKIR